MVKILFLFGVLIFILNQCSFQEKNTSNAVLNKPSLLAFQRRLGVDGEGLELYFTELSDARCPAKVRCIWEGEAKITLIAIKNQDSLTLNIKIKGLCFDENGGCSEEHNVFGYNIKILYLYPYPKKREIIKQKYRVKLLINKK